MGKFLRSLTDGSLRCKYCGDNECLCMEDGHTDIGIVAIWHRTDKATLIQFRKQTLPNGKKIPAGYKVWIRNMDISGTDDVLKKITIENDAINKLVFNT